MIPATCHQKTISVHFVPSSSYLPPILDPLISHRRLDRTIPMKPFSHIRKHKFGSKIYICSRADWISILERSAKIIGTVKAFDFRSHYLINATAGINPQQNLASQLHFAFAPSSSTVEMGKKNLLPEHSYSKSEI